MSTTLNLTDPKASDYAGPCPRCSGPVPNAQHHGEYPGALSRFDNETYVCSSCGSEEAMMMGSVVPFDVGLYSPEADALRDAARSARRA